MLLLGQSWRGRSPKGLTRHLTHGDVTEGVGGTDSVIDAVSGPEG